MQSTVQTSRGRLLRRIRDAIQSWHFWGYALLAAVVLCLAHPMATQTSNTGPADATASSTSSSPEAVNKSRPKEDDMEARTQSLYSAGIAAIEREDYGAAIKNLGELVAIFEDLEMDRDESVTFVKRDLGLALILSERFAEGVDQLVPVINVLRAQENPDAEEMLFVYELLATAFSELKKLPEQAVCLEEACLLQRDHVPTDPNEFVTNLVTLAQIQMALDEPKLAAISIGEAVRFFAKAPSVTRDLRIAVFEEGVRIAKVLNETEALNEFQRQLQAAQAVSERPAPHHQSPAQPAQAHGADRGPGEELERRRLALLVAEKTLASVSRVFDQQYDNFRRRRDAFVNKAGVRGVLTGHVFHDDKMPDPTELESVAGLRRQALEQVEAARQAYREVRRQGVEAKASSIQDW